GGLIVGGMAAPAIVRRVRPALVMSAGLAVAAVGLGLLSQITTTSGLALYVAGSVVFALGLAPVFTLATDTAISTTPPPRAGVAVPGRARALVPAEAIVVVEAHELDAVAVGHLDGAADDEEVLVVAARRARREVVRAAHDRRRVRREVDDDELRVDEDVADLA